MSKTEYVLSLATMIPHIDTQFITLIERTKRDWQFGRLNLPGGHVEPGEQPEQAACRELFEETGIHASLADTRIMGVMEGEDWIVHVCLCPYRDWWNGARQEARQTVEDQPVHYLRWREIKDDPRLIPNLTVIIPLCNARLSGWKLTPDGDDERNWKLQLATFNSQVPNVV